jgi:predicted DNA binding protein
MSVIGEFSVPASALAMHPTLAATAESALERLDELEGGTLYRAEWPPDVESVGHANLETGATILEATGRNEEWELRLRFDSHEDVGKFYEYCEDHDIPYDDDRIYDPRTLKGGGQFGVTPKQAEPLVTSLESGFYDIPQEATMTDVAETIGISQQALSKRLRRAHGNLVSNVLTVEEFDTGE